MGAGSSPAAPLLINLPTKAPGKAAEDGPCPRASAHVGNLQEAYGSWL